MSDLWSSLYADDAVTDFFTDFNQGPNDSNTSSREASDPSNAHDFTSHNTARETNPHMAPHGNPDPQIRIRRYFAEGDIEQGLAMLASMLNLKGAAASDGAQGFIDNFGIPMTVEELRAHQGLNPDGTEMSIVSENDLLNGDPDLTEDTTADDLQVSAYMSTLQGTAAGVIKGMGPPSAGGSGKKSIEEEVMEILQNQALQGGGIGIEINPKNGDSFLLKLTIDLQIPVKCSKD